MVEVDSSDFGLMDGGRRSPQVETLLLATLDPRHSWKALVLPGHIDS